VIRMSAIRNLPVICEEKQIGLLHSVVLDEAQRSIRVLIVSCGLRGKRIVLRGDVLALSDGFILVARSQRYRRAAEKQGCLFVRDTTGLLVGRIADAALDERTLEVAAILVATGVLPPGRSGGIWAFAYVCTDERTLEVTVPVSLGSELL